MKKTLFILFFILILLTPFVSQARLNISPGTQEELIGILKGLAGDHQYKQWCEKDCGQIHQIELSGKIQSGTLSVNIKGNIIGGHNGVLPLFGAIPAIEIVSLKNNKQDVPLVFHNKAYHTFLSPGPFNLIGEIKINPNASTNITLPGAVGKVVLNISDQEPLLKNVKFGQKGGSFQLVSAQKNKASQKEDNSKQNLRLKIKKHFKIARDKSFVYTIHTMGAKSGQVIKIPLKNGEKVLETSPKNAKITEKLVEFTATGNENTFMLQGEWTKKAIALIAPTGAIQETWSVDCQGAYDCNFSGDIEKSITSLTHEWLPIAGQKLTVTWNELTILNGQSTVAQVILLDSSFTGNGLKQSLFLEVDSSEVSKQTLTLPKNAQPTSLNYNSTQSSVLRDSLGNILLTIPNNESRVNLNWDVREFKSNSIPLPQINLPAAKWFFWVTPNKHETAILTGGPKGSPVVLFWPRLGFCLLIGLLFLFAEKKITKKITTKSILFLIMCMGYALTNAYAIMGFIAMLIIIRWLAKISHKRTIFGVLFELGLLLGFVIFTISSFLFILNKSFFSATPFEYENFCSTNSPMSGLSNYSSFCWEVALTQTGQTLKSPYLLTIPTLAIRIAYFVWALIAGTFLFTELKNLWFALKHYFSLGLKPIFIKKK